MVRRRPDPILQIVLLRLERISADSPLAHRASGIRGSILRALERQERGEKLDPVELDFAISSAFDILQQAAEASLPRPLVPAPPPAPEPRRHARAR